MDLDLPQAKKETTPKMEVLKIDDLKNATDFILAHQTEILAAMVQQLADITAAIDELAASHSVMALYFERKGINEGLFTQDEIDEDDEDDGELVV